MVFNPFFNRNIKIFYTKLFLSFSFLNDGNVCKRTVTKMIFKDMFFSHF